VVGFAQGVPGEVNDGKSGDGSVEDPSDIRVCGVGEFMHTRGLC
jgi:hypothetical protein